MDGYQKSEEVINELIKNAEKNLKDAQDKFLENKNKNEDAIAHEYDMMVIAYNHTIENLRMGLRSIKLHKTRCEFDNSVHAHEQTMEFMINSLTK